MYLLDRGTLVYVLLFEFFNLSISLILHVCKLALHINKDCCLDVLLLVHDSLHFATNAIVLLNLDANLYDLLDKLLLGSLNIHKVAFPLLSDTVGDSAVLFL